MVPIIVTLLQWDFVVTTIVIFFRASLIEKIGFPFFKKNRPRFQETKVNFLFNVFFY